MPPSHCFTTKDSISDQTQGFKSTPIEDFSLDSLPESFDWGSHDRAPSCVAEENEKRSSKPKGGYLCNSIESKLIKPRVDWGLDSANGDSPVVDFAGLDVLLKLNSRDEEGDGIVEDEDGGLVQCPLCGIDISDLSDEERQVHTNDCLDKGEAQPEDVSIKYQTFSRLSLLILNANCTLGYFIPIGTKGTPNS